MKNQHIQTPQGVPLLEEGQFIPLFAGIRLRYLSLSGASFLVN